MNQDIKNRTEYNFQTFTTRKERYEFLQTNFKKILLKSKSILDVGCDENYFKKIYGDKVFGIDIAGQPDRKVDLEKETLKFLPDSSYEVIICTEVLEHLDNLHEVIEELMRVSGKYIIISLSNCANIRYLIHILRTKKTGKFYGLPLSKPEDRHKWFFSHREIAGFAHQFAEKNNLIIERLIYHFNLGIHYKKDILHKIQETLIFYFIKLFKFKIFSQDIFILFKKK